jgi:hypothetical protein
MEEVMPATIHQQYIDPSEGQYRTRGIQIDVEIVRPDDMSQMNAIVQLRADPVHHPHLAEFLPVFVNPVESLGILLDGKRTTNPPGCLQTRLAEESESDTFIVDDIRALDLCLGDPVVVMDHLKEGNTRRYGLVEVFGDGTLTIQSTQEPVHFFKGAFIQNLANRWHEKSNVVGAKSQLKRPGTSTFRSKFTGKGVELIISVPLNIGTLCCYDVYVRNHPFNDIEAHWVPDVSDLPNNADRVTVESYNGGHDAGGGVIADDQPSVLVCAVVGKDKRGHYNVHESAIQPQIVSTDRGY